MDYNIIAQVVILVDAVLAMYLFYWLNTRHVKEYYLYKNEQNRQ